MFVFHPMIYHPMIDHPLIERKLPMTTPSENLTRQPNWRNVGLFLGLTFVLTWGLDLIVYLSGGLQNPAVGLLLQTQMLLPAFSAILLGMFFFTDSPFYFRTYREKPRWFLYLYLLFTVVYALIAFAALALPASATALSATAGTLNILVVMLLVALYAIAGKKEFGKIGLQGGPAKYWLLYGLAFILIYAINTGLNALFRLGQPVDLAQLQATIGAQAMPSNVFFLVMILQTVVVGPFLGLVISFGEEYGWRGFLQTELIKMGKVRGIFLLGLIWGIWHWPLILMGYNYPGQPVLGVILMTAYTVVLAFVLGYAVLKTGSIWLAAFLHAVNNQVLAFLMMMVYQPSNLAFSFGIGLYGILLWVPIILLLLRDPIWRNNQPGTPVEGVPPLVEER